MILKIVLFGFHLPEPQTNDLLLFVALLQIFITIFVLSRFSPSFRRFIYATLTDATGRPDAKLMTAFAAFSLVAFMVLRGSFFKDYWPPEWLLNSLLLFISALLGVDAGITATKIIKGDNPKPENINVE